MWSGVVSSWGDVDAASSHFCARSRHATRSVSDLASAANRKHFSALLAYSLEAGMGRTLLKATQFKGNWQSLPSLLATNELRHLRAHGVDCSRRAFWSRRYRCQHRLAKWIPRLPSTRRRPVCGHGYMPHPLLSAKSRVVVRPRCRRPWASGVSRRRLPPGPHGIASLAADRDCHDRYMSRWSHPPISASWSRDVEPRYA